MEINNALSKLYVGIDINDSFSMVSFMREGEKDTVTAVSKRDKETFLFPTSLYIGKSRYYRYGYEAEKKKDDPAGEFYDHLYFRALDLADTDGAGECVERLAIYVRRLIKLKENIYQKEDFNICLCITVPEITRQAVTVLNGIRQQLADEIVSFKFIDYCESFYYYTYNQEGSIYTHDTALFNYNDEDQIRFTLLTRVRRNLPEVIYAGEESYQAPSFGDDKEGKDRYFADLIKRAFEKRIISAVYLIGDGFDGDWLHDTLKTIGPNKRVFVGKNLYTKGAAYAAFAIDNPERWPFAYDCKYKLKTDVVVEAYDMDGQHDIYLLTSGRDWYDEHVEFDVLLLDSTDISLTIRNKRDGSEKKVTLPMNDIWKRNEKTRKIHVCSEMSDEHTLNISVKDAGFGAFYKPIDAGWDFVVEV